MVHCSFNGSVEDGECWRVGVGLPVGCRFEPSEKELLLDYLYNKVSGNPLPSNVISECDLYGDEEPWRKAFDESGETCLYFFTKLKKKTAKGLRVGRTSSGGCVTWRSQNDKPIYAGDFHIRQQPIGHKRTFSYVPKKISKSSKKKGEWVMHEFRLPNPDNHDYVICRITRRPPSRRNHHHDDGKEPEFEATQDHRQHDHDHHRQDQDHQDQDKDQEMDIGTELMMLLED